MTFILGHNVTNAVTAVVHYLTFCFSFHVLVWVGGQWLMGDESPGYARLQYPLDSGAGPDSHTASPCMGSVGN